MATRTAFDTPGARSIRAISITHGGAPAGRIVTYTADSGGVTATVQMYHGCGPWAVGEHGEPRSWAVHGRATGWGYDKHSAAIADAVGQLNVAAGMHPARKALWLLNAAGLSAVRSAFVDAGYGWHEVL